MQTPARTILTASVFTTFVFSIAPDRTCRADPPADKTHKGTMSPGSVQHGKASYYSDDFEGQKTASGERYDDGKLTAAHRSLPLGSKVEVKNPKSGERVTVKVNDRGPYKKDRVIDLSETAAKKIEVDKKGTTPVEVKVVSTPTPDDTTASQQSEGKK